jgi:hypothetical protein
MKFLRRVFPVLKQTPDLGGTRFGLWLNIAFVKNCHLPMRANQAMWSITKARHPMKLIHAVVASVLLTTTSPFVFAQAVQPEADRIKAALEKYTGGVAGVVAVAPKGNDYILTLDFKPYGTLLKDKPFTIDMAPVTLTLTPKGNGMWNVVENESLAVAFKFGPTFNYKMSVGNAAWSATYDENNRAFLSSTMELKDVVSAQTSSDPETKGAGDTVTKIGVFKGTSKSTLVSPGIFDVEQHYETIDSVQEIKAQGQSIVINSPLSSSDTQGKGVRNAAVLDFFTFVLAHTNKEAILRDQVQLKEKLLAMLPLFDSLTYTGKADKTTVTTPFGIFSMAKADAGSKLNGLTKDGNIQFDVAVSGLDVPTGLLPNWANDLMLRDLKIDVATSGFDLDATARHFINAMDLNHPDLVPSDKMVELLPKLLPKGAVKISVNPSSVANSISTISYDGNVEAMIAGSAQGKINISMTGLDALAEKIQAAAATEPTAQQISVGIVGAKGLAKPDGKGGYLWVIDISPDGKVLVNGLDVSKMTGQP